MFSPIGRRLAVELGIRTAWVLLGICLAVHVQNFWFRVAMLGCVWGGIYLGHRKSRTILEQADQEWQQSAVKPKEPRHDG